MPDAKPYFPAPPAALPSGGPFREAAVPAPAPAPAPLPAKPAPKPAATPSKPSGRPPLPVELEADHIDETFGFSAGAVGSAGLLVALGMIVDSTTTYAWWHLPAALGTGVLGFAYDVLRRRRRLAFVAHGRDHIGVYRKKRLACIARLDELVRYRLSLLNTFRQFMAFGLSAVGGGFVFGMIVAFGEHRYATAMLVSAGAMIGGTLGFVTTAWSRVVCIHFVLQNPQVGSEVIVLRRRDATTLNLTQ